MSRALVIRLFYGFQFFFSLLLWHPIFYEFHKRWGHLNDDQIFGIQSIYYLAFMLFEFPTGFLADRWSYRKCMILGGGVLVVSNLLPIFVPTYGGFVAHWLAIALSRSLISGAASAYLYTYLSQNGEPEDYKRVEGLAKAFSLLGKVAGWAGIGYAMDWQVTSPYWLTALAASISVVYALRLPEVAPEVPNERTSPLYVGAVLVRSPRLMLVMLQGTGIFVLTRIYQINLFQPILEQRGFGVAALGLIIAANTLFEAAGSAWPQLMRRWASDLNAVFWLTGVMALSMAGTAWAGAWGAFWWLNVFALAAGLAYPIQRQVINDAIPDSRYRASFLSAESFLDRAVCAGVAWQLGAWVSGGRSSTDHFLVVSAEITAVGIVILMVAFALLNARRT